MRTDCRGDRCPAVALALAVLALSISGPDARAAESARAPSDEAVLPQEDVSAPAVAPEAAPPSTPEAARRIAASERSAATPFRRGLRILIDDGRAVYSSPARWRGRGWALFSGIVAGTALLVTRDEEIRASVTGSDAPDRESIGSGIRRLGDPEVGAILPWISYAWAKRAGSRRFEETSLIAFEAWVLSAAATAVLKGATGRLGPADGEENAFFKGGDFFPSGHTARTMAIAAVFAERHGRRAAWIGYTVGSLVGLAMIDADIHWTSDVAGGAALGIAIGRALAKRHPLGPAAALPQGGTEKPAAAIPPDPPTGSRRPDREREWSLRPLRGGALVTLRY